MNFVFAHTAADRTAKHDNEDNADAFSEAFFEELEDMVTSISGTAGATTVTARECYASVGNAVAASCCEQVDLDKMDSCWPIPSLQQSYYYADRLQRTTTESFPVTVIEPATYFMNEEALPHLRQPDLECLTDEYLDFGGRHESVTVEESTAYCIEADHECLEEFPAPSYASCFQKRSESEEEEFGGRQSVAVQEATAFCVEEGLEIPTAADLHQSVGGISVSNLNSAYFTRHFFFISGPKRG